MWKTRLHKWAHRVVGWSVATAGLLTQLNQLDLSKVIGSHAGVVVGFLGAAIVVLEFIPAVGQWLDTIVGNGGDDASRNS